MGPKFWHMPPIGVSPMFLPDFALAFLQNYHLKYIIKWLTSKYLQNLRSKVFGMKNRIGTFPISYLKPSVKLIQTMFFLSCRRNPTELFFCLLIQPLLNPQVLRVSYSSQMDFAFLVMTQNIIIPPCGQFTSRINVYLHANAGNAGASFFKTRD